MRHEVAAICGLAAMMISLLILTTALSAPRGNCAELAYCMAEAQQAFCLAWPYGRPANLTEEEMPVHALYDAMEAKGCPLPDDRLRCPAPAPARVAPPVDCAALAVP